MVIFKGATLANLAPMLGWMLCLGVVLNAVAFVRFRKA